MLVYSVVSTSCVFYLCFKCLLPRPNGHPHLPREDLEDPAETAKFTARVCTACEVSNSQSQSLRLSPLIPPSCLLSAPSFFLSAPPPSPLPLLLSPPASPQEEGLTVVAVVECSECGDSLCGPCREAHSKTRVTKGHTVTEVAGPVIHHPRSDAMGLDCKLTDFSPKLLLMFSFCILHLVGCQCQSPSLLLQEGCCRGS